ncbi:c-type cytochrome [bacterium]|nr:c-type cytochrome [bacterium]
MKIGSWVPVGALIVQALLLGTSALLSGCGEAGAATSEDSYPLTPSPYRLSNKEPSVPVTPQGQTAIAGILRSCFGEPERPFLPGLQAADNLNPKIKPDDIRDGWRGFISGKSSMPGSPQRSDGNPVVRGRQLFRQHCVHCHGYYGGGDGPTANFLMPKPRDFRRGLFKFVSTDAKNYNRPTHDDLRRTIAQGIPGTMMPAFGPREGIPEIGIVAGFAGPEGFDVDAVAWYVQVVAMRGELEKKLVEALKQNNNDLFADDDLVPNAIDGVLSAWDGKRTVGQIVKPTAPRPPRTAKAIEESVKKGEQLYRTKEAQCVTCHGKTGKGDGESAFKDESKRDKDDWGEPIRPANLTLGVYRGGRRPIDLFRRVKSGVEGVMPGFGGTLTDDQIWNLVDYVQSLALESKPEK